jgi:hypothetical protein
MLKIELFNCLSIYTNIFLSINQILKESVIYLKEFKDKVSILINNGFIIK